MKPVTETMPDNLPDWAEVAFKNGTFFKEALHRDSIMEAALEEIVSLHSFPATMTTFEREAFCPHWAIANKALIYIILNTGGG